MLLSKIGKMGRPVEALKKSSGGEREARAVAVLTSGGLDSSGLLGEMLSVHAAVYPIYIRGGLSWEAAELHYLRQFLHALHRPELQPSRCSSRYRSILPVVSALLRVEFQKHLLKSLPCLETFSLDATR